MARPIVTEATEILYGYHAPIAQEDGSLNWDLLLWLETFGIWLQRVDDYIRDTDDGPGWSLVVDVDRCPEEALPYLAQFAGVSLVGVSDPVAQRDKVRDRPNLKRGRPASILSAAQTHLTGAKTVLMQERFDDNAYQLLIRTFADETPDEAVTLADILTQKPGGIVLDYDTLAGTSPSWALLTATYANWTAVSTAFSTWQEVIDNTP